MSNQTPIKLSEKVGKHYNDWWNSKKRYTVCKGGRGSKKSVTTGLWLINNLMKLPQSNALIVRRYGNTHRDSTFAQLKWSIDHLGVGDYWKATVSPMELIYKPTGQKIIFRGFDDGTKITSLTVDTGFMTFCWIEEAFEITDEQEFNKLDMSFRGKLPSHLFHRFLITFNPWSDKHWLKDRFFDNPDKNTFTKTTCYLHNEFLGEDDIALFEEMKQRRPKRYLVEGLGEWGISKGLIYEDWWEKEFNYKELLKDKHEQLVFGLDFGYVNSKTAFVGALVNKKKKTIHIFDEHYKTGMMNDKIAKMIISKGYRKEHIIADCAEPKSIDEIRRHGIHRLDKSFKGKDSLLNGISYIQQFDIFVHPMCSNTKIELSNYRWEEKDGLLTNRPIKEFDHILDALRYAMQIVKKPRKTPTALKQMLGI
jgi:phage terminase large subunit